jgi:hypothetical protein
MQLGASHNKQLKRTLCHGCNYWQVSEGRLLVFILLVVTKTNWAAHCSVKVKSSPITGLDRPRRFQVVEVPRFLDNRHTKVVRLSAMLVLLVLISVRG